MSATEAELTPWAKDLLDEQRVSASYEGSSARMLAGPGTGKTRTLQARVEWLVLDKKVEPKEVMALTFTRAAAAELRGRVNKALEGKAADRPRIVTLHSFALRTLLRNAAVIDALPRPLRIADDWEERYIVQEDLKEITGTTIDDVDANFQALSADWDTLRADATEPNPLKADGKFVGAWEKHRSTYGYTLRAELVYQLKKALEQHGSLKFDAELKHLLVDEYQDLNACDLDVVARLVARGAVLFAAGDDDQSIYGFRHANPEGIRRFDKDYSPSVDLNLAQCMRCDRAVMELARFVANLDTMRLDKPWTARNGAGDGEVHLLRFATGNDEADGIASLCKDLITSKKLMPHRILILIRSDRYGAFSTPLAAAMKAADVPFSQNVEGHSPLDTASGRILLSVMRLAVAEDDSLAWRTLLKVRKKRVGKGTISDVEARARKAGIRFVEALKAYAPTAGGALQKEFSILSGWLDEAKQIVGKADEEVPVEVILDRVLALSGLLAKHGVPDLEDATEHLRALAVQGDAATFAEVLGVVSMVGLTPEQETMDGNVNMLTMHKAKGLSADAVIIMACEDEYLPGRQEAAEDEADERRLLYVSLTRARQRLFISYAEKRYGRQQHTGRNHGKQKRTLTRYLRNAPVKAVPAEKHLAQLGR